MEAVGGSPERIELKAGAGIGRLYRLFRTYYA